MCTLETNSSGQQNVSGLVLKLLSLWIVSHLQHLVPDLYTVFACFLASLAASSKSYHRRGQHPLSSRTVRCLTSVEAFSLESDGLEYVTTHYKAAFKSPRVQGIIRYLSLHWRSLAARRIQKAWRASRERKAHGGSASSFPSVGSPRITRFGSINRLHRRAN
jgi:hypothetical protein